MRLEPRAAGCSLGRQEHEERAAPDRYRVVRRQTAPGLDGAAAFTVWLPFAPNGHVYEGTYLDPEVTGLAAGQYQVIAHWSSSGDEEILDSEWLSLVEHPDLLRGSLLSATTLEPCVGGGLLECVEVELMNPQWWDTYGPDVMLDIYGWPINVDGRDDCAVRALYR